MDLDEILEEEFEDERDDNEEREEMSKDLPPIVDKDKFPVITDKVEKVTFDERMQKETLNKSSRTVISKKDIEQIKEAKSLDEVMNIYKRYAFIAGPSPTVTERKVKIIADTDKKYVDTVAKKLTDLVNTSHPKELNIDGLTTKGRISALAITCSMIKALYETDKYDYRNGAAKQSADKIWPVIEEYAQTSTLDLIVGKRLMKEHRTLQQSLARVLFPKLEELAPRVIGPAIQKNGVSAKDVAFPYI